MRFLCAMLIMLPLVAGAVQPDEMLSDPGLESRARAISQDLRCPVCQGESIDESDAGVARDLRLLVRERLVAGDSNQAVLDYISARYGEFVLFRPQARGANLILWWGGPVLLVVVLAWLFVWIRGQRATPAVAPLSDAEKARLKALIGD